MIKDAVFIGVVFVTILGAFIAVWLRNIFYNALGLILSLAGMAGLFLYLSSEFLAVMQVIIYIGAVSIAIIFAIMLSHPDFRQHEPRSAFKVARGALIAGISFFALQKTIRATSWTVASPDGDYSIRAIGRELLTVYALPFEAVSLVLVIAILGALLLSGRGGQEESK